MVVKLTRPFMALEMLRLLEATVTDVALSDDHDEAREGEERGNKEL
jgi:hypothetical protein